MARTERFCSCFCHPFRQFRLKPADSTDTKLTPEELRTLVLEAGNYIPKKHQSILLNLFDLESITVDDVMTPRSQIEAIDIDAPPATLHQQVATAYHRRLPVYQEEPENIIGIVVVRRLLSISSGGEVTAENIRTLMRDPYFIPSGTPLFTQLQQFQENQDRLCFVVDEYGELMGLLTLEDLNSSNGTFVNRARVHPGEKRALNLNDVIQIGTVHLKVKV